MVNVLNGGSHGNVLLVVLADFFGKGYCFLFFVLAMSDSVSKLTTDLLVHELKHVTGWEYLGFFLGFDMTDIKEIEQDHPDTARRNVLVDGFSSLCCCVQYFSRINSDIRHPRSTTSGGRGLTCDGRNFVRGCCLT